MPNVFDRVLNPDWYHGHNKRPPFFEGWYFKLVDASEQRKFAIIPGVFLNQDANKTHAFIQVLNGNTGDASYIRFSFESFNASEDKFEVTIQNNQFSRDRMHLNIQDESMSISGTLQFQNPTPWDVTWRSIGAMGFFGWIPFMECNHGVVSFNHTIQGHLTINGTSIDFTNGLGYIEKDWGSSFPAAYIWQQSNHFDEPNTSLMASVAIIPNFGVKFNGFTIGFHHQGNLYRFATYTRAKLDHLKITDDTVEWRVSDRQYVLEMTSVRTRGGLLLGPERSDMHMRVDETLQSSIHVRLLHKDGSVIFEGTGRNAGLEVIGNTEKLTTE